MRLLAYALSALFMAGSLLAQQPAGISQQKTGSGTHLLPPSHFSVRTDAVTIADRLGDPHWWNDNATFSTVSHGGDAPNVAMVNRDGTLAFKTTLTAPNADLVRVTDAAASKTGSVIASVAFEKDKNKKVSSYIAELDGQGHIKHQLTTFPFIPEMVCPAADGTFWAFGWDWYSGNQPRTYPHRSNSMVRHYSFTAGLLKEAELGNSIVFGHRVTKGTAVACTENKAWVYYGERNQFIAYDEQLNSLRIYKVVMPAGAPSDVGISGCARTTAGNFYGSVTDGAHAWLGLFSLYVHDDVAEWVAVDTPGDFKTAIRVFGSSGNDLVYSRTAWVMPTELLFSTMPSSAQSNAAASAAH